MISWCPYSTGIILRDYLLLLQDSNKQAFKRQFLTEIWILLLVSTCGYPNIGSPKHARIRLYRLPVQVLNERFVRRDLEKGIFITKSYVPNLFLLLVKGSISKKCLFQKTCTYFHFILFPSLLRSCILISFS